MKKAKVYRALSHKQVAVIEAVVKGAPDGDFLDIDQLLEVLPYETTKQSLQFTIRSLVERGFIEKKYPQVRRGRRRRLLAPTPNATAGTDPFSGSFDVIVEGD